MSGFVWAQLINHVDGMRFTVDRGADDGVKKDMVGDVRSAMIVRGKRETFSLARFRVVAVGAHRAECEVDLQAGEPMQEIRPGMEVVFDQKLLPGSGPPVPRDPPADHGASGSPHLGAWTLAGNQSSLFIGEFRPGAVLVFEARGQIKMGALVGFNGPDGGHQRWILKKAGYLPPGALIGELHSVAGTEHFLIGSGCRYVVPRSGRIALTVNETILADNEGSFFIQCQQQ